MIEKHDNTMIERHWCKSPMHIDAVKEKRNKTMKERYWSDEYFNSEEYKSNIKQYNLNKFWKERYAQTDDFSEKSKTTCLKKYWVEKYTQSEMRKSKKWDIIRKTIETNLEKHWVEYGFQLNPGWTSKINNDMYDLLVSKWYTVEKEKKLWRFRYDLCVNWVLVEINPGITHNVDYSPYWECYDKYYHKNKTINAIKYWYRCIHKFDWISIDDLLKAIDGDNEYSWESVDMSIYDYKKLLDNWYTIKEWWEPNWHEFNFRWETFTVYDCWTACFINKKST